MPIAPVTSPQGAPDYLGPPLTSPGGAPGYLLQDPDRMVGVPVSSENFDSAKLRAELEGASPGKAVFLPESYRGMIPVPPKRPPKVNWWLVSGLAVGVAVWIYVTASSY